MKIKIGDKVFDSKNEAIAIYLDDKCKSLISNMSKDDNIFLAYPSTEDIEKIDKIRGWARKFKQSILNKD